MPMNQILNSLRTNIFYASQAIRPAFFHSADGRLISQGTKHLKFRVNARSSVSYLQSASYMPYAYILCHLESFSMSRRSCVEKQTTVNLIYNQPI